MKGRKDIGTFILGVQRLHTARWNNAVLQQLRSSKLFAFTSRIPRSHAILYMSLTNKLTHSWLSRYQESIHTQRIALAHVAAPVNLYTLRV